MEFSKPEYIPNWNILSKIKKMSIIFYILNLIDAFATYYFINTGFFHETNPVMNRALSTSPALFFFIKIVFVFLVLYFLAYKHAKKNFNKLSEMNIIKWVLKIVIIIYAAIDIIHLFNYICLKFVLLN